MSCSKIKATINNPSYSTYELPMAILVILVQALCTGRGDSVMITVGLHFSMIS